MQDSSSQSDAVREVFEEGPPSVVVEDEQVEDPSLEVLEETVAHPEADVEDTEALFEEFSAESHEGYDVSLSEEDYVNGEFLPELVLPSDWRCDAFQ